MRTLLAVLAWAVIGLGALGFVFACAGVAVVAQEHQRLGGTVSAALVTNTLAHQGFVLLQAVALGLGLLFVLDLDKRVRAGREPGFPGPETR